MADYESNEHTARQGERQGEQDPARTDFPDALAANILAHLGQLKDTPSRVYGTLPAWQRHIIDVQKLTETCTGANVRQVVQALEEDLGQKHKAVRMAVLRALGKIYLSFPGYVRWELFMRGLADQAPEVRATTIQVFMAWLSAPHPRPPHAQAIERLAKKLSQLDPDGRASEDESVNISIIQLMGLLGDLAPAPAVGAIVHIACNREEDWPLREAALLVLSSLYARLSASQRLQVDGALYDTHPFVRQVAMRALRWWVPVAAVLEVLHTGERHKQVCAAQVLGQWGERLTLSTLALDQHEASSVRAAALLGLAQLAQTQDLVIKNADLDQLVGERDFSVRIAAEVLKEVLEVRKPQGDREEGIG